jgi:2-polyprenyl-6-methoxyphenol hydroxylase-like FAD-dependent oxidoreductase
MAIGLRHLGVDCVLVEKHPSTLNFPKGRGVTVRSVEIFRQWGLEDAVTSVSLPRDESLFIFEGDTLLGDDFARHGFGQSAEVSTVASPTNHLICSQELLEPVLRDAARELGAVIRFSTELRGLAQDDTGVTARVVDGGGGEVDIRALYVVAADGVRGPTRELLGISRSVIGDLGRRISVLVEADLGERIAGRKSAVYWL